MFAAEAGSGLDFALVSGNTGDKMCRFPPLIGLLIVFLQLFFFFS